MKSAIVILVAGMGANGTRPHAIEATERHSLAGAFEQNQGQMPGAIKFLSRGYGYELFLTERDAVLTLAPASGRQQVLRMSLEGSRTPDQIEGIDRLIVDPSEWNPSVQYFGGVRYRGVYPGIDLLYRRAGGRLAYDFVLKAGVAADRIKLHFDGVQEVRVEQAGALELRSIAGTLRIPPVVAYQEIDGQRRPVMVAYQSVGENRVGFRVGPFERKLPLIIGSSSGTTRQIGLTRSLLFPDREFSKSPVF